MHEHQPLNLRRDFVGFSVSGRGGERGEAGGGEIVVCVFLRFLLESRGLLCFLLLELGFLFSLAESRVLVWSSGLGFPG